MKTLAKMIAVPLGALVVSACSVVGMDDTEIAPYEVLKKDGAIEVRRYPSLMLAETASGNGATHHEGTRGPFMRLFRYIDGSNQSQENIAMTAPVLIAADDKPGDHRWSMSFVLPESYDAKTAPQPNDPAVAIRQSKPMTVAVIRYSGAMDQATVTEKTEALRTWLKGQSLPETGAPREAYYNPPWTLPMMRRNEVMIPVDIKSGF